jgi:hypothetical protein
MIPVEWSPPTTNCIQAVWHGAALFRFEGGVICELWVLGDLAGLDRVLLQNQTTGP